MYFNLESMPTKEEVIEVLKKVNDPEIGIDVWTLELIYNVDVEDNKANIKMTFTTPMCPYGPMLVEEIKSKIREIGVEDVDIEITFDPPWQPSEQLRATLGV
jgi:metal-sulfur cluster biosynthetic enzyme